MDYFDYVIAAFAIIALCYCFFLRRQISNEEEETVDMSFRDSFVMDASIEFYSARIHGLFQANVDRAGIAKQARKDAEALFEELMEAQSQFEEDESSVMPDVRGTF